MICKLISLFINIFSIILLLLVIFVLVDNKNKEIDKKSIILSIFSITTLFLWFYWLFNCFLIGVD